MKEESEYVETWNEKLASETAREEGVALTARHWKIIRFARKFYEDNLIDPSVQDIEKKIGISREGLLRLFQKGARQVSKIAGIPYTGCM